MLYNRPSHHITSQQAVSKTFVVVVGITPAICSQVRVELLLLLCPFLSRRRRMTAALDSRALLRLAHHMRNMPSKATTTFAVRVRLCCRRRLSHGGERGCRSSIRCLKVGCTQVQCRQPPSTTVCRCRCRRLAKGTHRAIHEHRRGIRRTRRYRTRVSLTRPWQVHVATCPSRRRRRCRRRCNNSFPIWQSLTSPSHGE